MTHKKLLSKAARDVAAAKKSLSRGEPLLDAIHRLLAGEGPVWKDEAVLLGDQLVLYKVSCIYSSYGNDSRYLKLIELCSSPKLEGSLYVDATHSRLLICYSARKGLFFTGRPSPAISGAAVIDVFIANPKELNEMPEGAQH